MICINPAAPTPDVRLMVEATLTAISGLQPAPAAPALPAATGSLTGQLSYPSEAIPPLRVVAYLAGSGAFFSVDTAANQTTYRLDNLPEGKYQVVAYVLPGGEMAGAYSQAVLCGLTAECADHALVDVIVFAGETTPDVNLSDWYGVIVPPMP